MIDVSNKGAKFRVVYQGRSLQGRGRTKSGGSVAVSVVSHVRILFSKKLRMAIVSCEATTGEDADTTWKPKDLHIVWPEMTRESIVLLAQQQVTEWSLHVRAAIPADYFLAEERERASS